MQKQKNWMRTNLHHEGALDARHRLFINIVVAIVEIDAIHIDCSTTVVRYARNNIYCPLKCAQIFCRLIVVLIGKREQLAQSKNRAYV